MTQYASRTLRNAIRVLGCALLVLPSAAFAHPGHDVAGAVHGFVHPFTGLDHLLAMLLVGLFAYQLGGRALWVLPLSFLAAMAMGGVLGFAAPGAPFVEIGIALSVILLGVIVALNLKAPVLVAGAMVGIFAIFHGFAHGAEMPGSAHGVSYGTGFMAGTGLLIALGIAAGFGLNKVALKAGGSLVRPAGTLAAVVGVGLLTGVS